MNRTILGLTLGLAAFTATGALVATAAAQVAGEATSAMAAAPITTRPGDADGAFVTGNKFSEPDGEKLYRRVCAGCHMPDARGVATGAGFYPALAGNRNLAASGYPVYILLKGKNGMPALGGMMTDQQVADVVNYVRTNFGNHYKDMVKPDQVKAVRG